MLRQSRFSSLHRFLLTVAAIVTFVPLKGQSGGLEVPDLGTVALGRGTAFAARADNLSAFYYNPAGLSKSKGFNLLLSGNLVNLNVDYLRSGSYDPATNTSEPVEINGQLVGNPGRDYSNYDPFTAGDTPPPPFSSVSNESRIGPAPMIVFNWGDMLGVTGLSAAIGLIPPSSFGAPKYTEAGAQRYALREANFLIVYPGLGVSYAINRYFQVGAVFLSGIGIFEQSQAIRPLPQLNNTLDYNEDAKGDASLKVEAKDLFMPTAIVGVLSHPIDWLEIGAAVKLPVKIEARGNITYTAPDTDLANSALVPGEDKVTLKQNFPWVVRLGARYIHQVFDVEADFVWENWSSLKEFEIDMEATLNEDATSENGALSPMPDSAIPKKFRDTFSARLGGDVEVWPKHLAVRAGGYYQSSAYPENYETFSVDFPFAEQVGVGAGLTWHAFSFLDVNAGFLHVFQPDVKVIEGIVQQQGMPFRPDAETEVSIGNTVNNGVYQVSMNIFGVSAEGHF